MQDHFLFDDNDSKQRGKDCDALCSEDKRLKFKWLWTEDCYRSGGPSAETAAGLKRSPGQCSEAILKNGWRLEVTFWHTDYDAEVGRYGRVVESYHIHYDEGTKKEPVLITRLNAQLKAEQLFEGLGQDILRQCRK